MNQKEEIGADNEIGGDCWLLLRLLHYLEMDQTSRRHQEKMG